METISNPMLDVVDMRKAAEVTHKHNALLVVDNTFATPVVCQPLSLGADLVVYSATKFMNGHSDILAGAVIGNDAKLMAQIEEDGHVWGPTMSPFDAFLFTRSLRTLELRVKAVSYTHLDVYKRQVPIPCALPLTMGNSLRRCPRWASTRPALRRMTSRSTSI